MDIKQEPTFYNIKQACNIVASKTGVANISVSFSMQMSDGSCVEFLDEHGAIIAACRIRYQNYLHIDEKTCDISVHAKLGDMSFGKSIIAVAVGIANEPAEPVVESTETVAQVVSPAVKSIKQ